MAHLPFVAVEPVQQDDTFGVGGCLCEIHFPGGRAARRQRKRCEGNEDSYPGWCFVEHGLKFAASRLSLHRR